MGILQIGDGFDILLLDDFHLTAVIVGQLIRICSFARPQLLSAARVKDDWDW